MSGYKQHSQRGVAVVEYIVAIGLISIVALAAVSQVGDNVNTNMDTVAEVTDLSPPPSPTPTPDFVAENTACLEGLNVGESCDNVGLVYIGDTSGERVYVQEPPASASDWPQFQYAVTELNENFTPVLFARQTGQGRAAHDELIAHPITHPGANHCASLGMYLPNRDQLRNLITPLRVQLRLDNNRRTMASTQWYFSASIVPWYNGTNVTYMWDDGTFTHTDTGVENLSQAVCVTDGANVQSFPGISNPR